ncbi:Alpha/Beta hydrolase protein [Chytridium lagenaria]|nr:Alpha/Beta hydrolase protein [Chytridium lagenaria]
MRVHPPLWRTSLSSFIRLRRVRCATPEDQEVSPAALVPLTRKEQRLADAETALLKRYVKTGFSQSLVDIGHGRRINTVTLQHASFTTSSSTAQPHHHPHPPPPRTVVLLHGYGAGLGFWCYNYDMLANMSITNRSHPSSASPTQIISLDWLGMGRSSRSTFPKHRQPRIPRRISPLPSVEHDGEAAETYFVESLEAWREKMGLERISLVAHSLGGFLGAAYAIRYPHRVENLILVSPFGLQPGPPSADVPIKRNSATPQLPLPGILRATGPFGPRLTHRLIGGRFPNLPAEDRRLLADYMYSISASAPPAGEYALNALMKLVLDGPARGVFARNPVADRLLVMLQNLKDIKGDTLRAPIEILFGDTDWMLKKDHFELPLVKKGLAKITVVRGAGHHIYLDNPEGFLEAVQKGLNM